MASRLSTPPMSTAVASLFVVVAFLLLSLHPTDAQIGVCNGQSGNNLPSDQEVVSLFQSNNIKAMRLYSPNQGTLKALQNSGIKLILDVPNDQVQSIAADQSAAMEWIKTNVIPYASSIKYIAVGNEVKPTAQEASSIEPAMKNVLNALKANNLGGQIKVSTSIDTSLIINSSPPSHGQFKEEYTSYINPILRFLASNGSPLLVNIYPYFAHKFDEHVSLEFALFTSEETVVTDDNDLDYDNLFDAIVDSVYAALSKADAPNTEIVVSETGWPSAGGVAASVDNAGTYYRNLINHVSQGTPLKQGKAIETYLFAMFDENNKNGDETERHFGIFTPTTQQPKYGQLNFS